MLLLGAGGWTAATAAVGCVLLFNLFVLPRLGGDRFRRSGETHPWIWGAVSFPLSILALLLLLPHRLEIVAAVWALIAAGDSAAGVLGSSVGAGALLPWNPAKSWAGSVAFFVAGGGAATAAAWWISGGAIEPFVVVAVCGGAALLAAMAESAPGLGDDNLVSTFVAAFALWIGLEAFSAPFLPVESTPAQIGLIVALHASLAWLLYRLGAVDGKASFVGGVFGAIVLGSLGWRGWLPLVTMIGIALVATRVGLTAKVERGTAERRRGRRSAGQIAAKGGWAAVLACLAALQPGHMMWPVLFAGALSAAAADTLATELGSLGKGGAFVLWRLRRGAAGTPGAISLLGTAAAILGAGVVAVVCSLTLLSPVAAAAVALAGFLATLLESLFAPPLEAVGLSTHELSNLLLTMTGAALAGLLAG